MSKPNILRVETAGIARVPPEARHGKPRDLVGFWFSANLEFATLSVGALGPGVLGLGGRAAFPAILFGNLIGATMLAACSVFGVSYGLPQMIQGTAWFGRLGNRAPAMLNFLCGFSWFAVNTVIGAFGVASLTGLPLAAGILLLSAVQTFIVVFGHDLVQATERWLS